MLTWLRYLDSVIRGEATRPSALRQGDIEQPVGGLAVIGMVLGAVYGLCMGSYALFQGGKAPLLQVIATAIKVPILFFLTLAVTLPSLYVFNALVGSRLTLQSVLRLLVISLIVMLAVLASLGPIVAFFAASTSSYPFMLLLNVFIFSVSGFLGLRYMLVTLHRLSLAFMEPTSAAPTFTAPPFMPPMDIVPPAGIPERSMAPPGVSSFESSQGIGPQGTAAPPPGSVGALQAPPVRLIGQDVRMVFRVWIVVFGLVGAQMAWVLRPFLGSPQHAFSWFRPRESNFFEAILYALQHLFR